MCECNSEYVTKAQYNVLRKERNTLAVLFLLQFFGGLFYYAFNMIDMYSL